MLHEPGPGSTPDPRERPPPRPHQPKSTRLENVGSTFQFHPTFISLVPGLGYPEVWHYDRHSGQIDYSVSTIRARGVQQAEGRRRQADKGGLVAVEAEVHLIEVCIVRAFTTPALGQTGGGKKHLMKRGSLVNSPRLTEEKRPRYRSGTRPSPSS